MSHMRDTDFDQLMKRLTENFNVLADEVQLLSDRKTVLEHKLRFAHEQYQVLALKYAPSDDPDISSTLAKLQLPADIRVNAEDRTSLVPLPPRRSGNSKQQTAEAIRDGRKASQLIASLKGWNRSAVGNRSASIATSSNNRNSRGGTSFTTFHEQDFTVPGRKSQLMCPFSQKSNKPAPNRDSSSQVSAMETAEETTAVPDTEDNTPHHSTDPICAALYAETHVSAPPSAAGSNKCPIRFLDQHSPEEVARYFETHKHEIPRSHEVCVKRYTRNEEGARKLDAKYGSMVSMLQQLGQKHQPMLPVQDEIEEYEVDKRSNGRVESWAKAVSEEGVDPAEATVNVPTEHEEEREGRYDRPLNEVRVGESPSRPWGISVPYDFPPAPHYTENDLQASPSAPAITRDFDGQAPVSPFGHGAKAEEVTEEPASSDREDIPQAKPTGQCPFSQNMDPNAPLPKDHPAVAPQDSGFGATYESQPQPEPTSQPAFIAKPEAATTTGNNGGPQMLFTGPVFIGYPVEQAMALMQQWQAGANQPR
ncbi:hypothetical protein VC83_05121 [Pseudogymnoascus destructans]|uniref:Uncharacterized protein n=2 Tax=Pseudogymnoascus destructans TaxID=655981 RepID=L8GEG7_PSED2|nr:uncharacterized protein VC83_05121 [Pseudogymnoascus destructans]ELR10546.1 hypothetical protein GMDG_04821 [Pseudogymnoascus destructans 20631-21]OAF58735.1 hypothetical protein VC83_05121 [Pseudogymnoascus destructans]